MPINLQHENVVWGTRCECGAPCSILQSRHHPWGGTDYVARIECPGCGRTHRVDRARADVFYDAKIHHCFRDVGGTVLDLGCGGGFLSRFVLGLDAVTEVFGIDNDEGCIGELEDLQGNDRFHFLNRDVADLCVLVSSISIDHVIGRDILMFVPDPERLIADVSSIAGKGFCLMGWFIPGNPRVENEMPPEEMARAFRSHGWRAEVEDLSWYKSGYLISGDR